MFKSSFILFLILIAINLAKLVYNIEEIEDVKMPLDDVQSPNNLKESKRNIFMWSSHMRNPEELKRKLEFQRMLEKKLRNLEEEKQKKRKQNNKILQTMKKYLSFLF
jgi:hypothetical protein